MKGLGKSAIQRRIDQQCKPAEQPKPVELYRHKKSGRELEVILDLGGACELQDKNGSTYATREALKNTDVWERLP
jgi:hypothetical protein